MNEIYIPKYFIAQELVDPFTYETRKEASFELIDTRVLITLDDLREKFGPITVNNWHIGGARKWSGLRTLESPEYSPYSQHTFGRAADCLFKNYEAETVRKHILQYHHDFPFITALEPNVSWLHFDVRNCKPIKTFVP